MDRGTVEIRILATNGTEQVFRAIKQDADQLARTLTEAGDDGGRAFDEIERGARDAEREIVRTEQAARSFGDRMEGAARTLDDFGEGLTVIGAGLVYAGTQAMENERQIIALEQAYGDAADQMIQFSEDLSDSLNGIFTDEDVRRGALYFATLREEYGLSIAQIEELMTRTADLAALRGISFEDASSRITSAIRGETEAAEYLNLTLNQQSIDREGLTLSMTNQEAAQFRLNAAMEQSAIYQGTAQRVAESSIGTYAQVRDMIQDMAVEVGNFIGPWGSMVTGFGTAAIGVSGTLGAFGRMATAMRNSTVLANALSVAMNPVVLGLGAATAAGIAWYQTLDEGESALDRFESGMDDLVDMDGQGFFENLWGAVKTFATGVDEAVFSVKDLETVLDDMQAKAEAANNSELAQAESMFRSVEAINDRYLAGEQLINGMTLEQRAREHAKQAGEDEEEVIKRITAAYQTDESERRSYLEAQEAIGDAFLDESIDAEALLQRLNELHNLYTTGAITHDQYKSSIVGIAEDLDDFRTDVEDTVTSVQRLNDVFRDGSEGPAMPGFEYELPTYGPALEELEEARERADEARKALADLATDGFGAGADAVTDFGDAVRAAMEDIDALGNAMGAGGKELFHDAIEGAAELREHVTALGDVGSEVLEDLAEEGRQARIEFIEAGNALAGWDDALSQLNMTSSSTEAMRFAENVQIANTALDNTFRIIVTNTDALGSTVQRTADWVDELAFAEDGWTRVHQLQVDGFINEAQMNAVLEARTSILEDNEHLQNDILTMQALQAPLIAEMVDQQRQYVHELSNQSAEQQLIALGWMDSATAAQAMEAQTLAAAAASGEFGAAGKQAVANWIEGAVQLNPILEQMLTDIGLVARDHEGNIVISWDNAEGTLSEIERLTESIVTLTDLLDDGVINGSVNVDVTGEENIDRIIDQVERVAGRRHNIEVDAETEHAEHQLQGVIDYLTELDGSTGTVTAVGVDDASDEISTVDALRSMLDGTTATVTNIGIDDASDEINSVRSNLGDLDGDTATVTVNAINNAGAVLGSVAAQLAALDGRTATSYVTTVYSSSGQRTAFADGGTVWGHELDEIVPHAANGRSVWVGEYGPELVTLPHGAQVTPHVASLSAAGGSGARGGGDVTFNITVNGSNRDEIYDVFEREIVPEMLRALREQERALGV